MYIPSMISMMQNSYLFLAVLSLAVCQTLGNVCPVIERREADTRLKSADPNGPDFREISGLAFSPRQKYNGKPIFFAVGDGGGDARIGMFDSVTGRRLRTLRVDRGFFRNSDWESMTIGSCGNSGEDKTCLYIMDAGDNKARESRGRSGRSSYKILKIREPDLDDYDDNDTIPTSRMSRLDYDYRHSSSPTNYADCEAMFLDHKGWGDDEDVGDIYLATKWDNRDIEKNRLFRIPADAWSSRLEGSVREYSPRTVGSTNYAKYRDTGGNHFMKTTWTSGEMSFDGTLIALGNLQKNFVWLRCPGTSIVDALLNPYDDSRACLDWSHPASGQVETFAFSPDRRYGLDIPEGNSPKMGWTKFSYDRDDSNRVCEDNEPTRDPTRDPTRRPTRPPTPGPTREPTRPPTPGPTREPTPNPTPIPTREPTSEPTYEPTPEPTAEESSIPTAAPSSCDGHQFKLALVTGEFAFATSWELLDGDNLVAEGTGYTDDRLVEISECVGVGVHTFKISNPLVDGVPGQYQIWYDDDVLYDSRGGYGSLKEISFTAGDGFIMPTDSPTSAPVPDSVYGTVCGGVCPSGTVANAESMVKFSGGAEYRCGTLDERYQQLFATPDACANLALSAQQAGCECATIAASDESPPEVVETQAEIPATATDSSSNTLLIVGLSLVCLACIGCLVKFFYAKKQNKADAVVDEYKVEVFDDATQRSGSSTEKSTSTLGPIVDENEGLIAKPGKALLSTIGKVGNFVQSWKVALSDVSSDSDEGQGSDEDDLPMSV